jgi:hypothetical protein
MSTLAACPPAGTVHSARWSLAAIRGGPVWVSAPGTIPVSASGDVFDARELLRPGTLDGRKRRLAFVVYGGINREDWRTVTVEHVTTTAADVDAQLMPMLRHDVRPARANLESWTTALVRETRELMCAVLPLAEREFLDRLNGAGEIVPALLTDDAALQRVIQEHPGLLWKAHNVMKHVEASNLNP